MQATACLAVRRGDRAKLRQGDKHRFQRGLLHDSKSLAATQARLVCNHYFVRWRAQGVAAHLARILSAELVGRGIRVNTLSPGPTDTAMFGRFPGEEQSRGG